MDVRDVYSKRAAREGTPLAGIWESLTAEQQSRVRRVASEVLDLWVSGTMKQILERIDDLECSEEVASLNLFLPSHIRRAIASEQRTPPNHDNDLPIAFDYKRTP